MGRGRPPANILIPFERQWNALQFAADIFYIMKLCSRLFVLYCRSRPKDDKSRQFDPHFEEVRGGVEPWWIARWKAGLLVESIHVRSLRIYAYYKCYIYNDISCCKSQKLCVFFGRVTWLLTQRFKLLSFFHLVTENVACFTGIIPNVIEIYVLEICST